ncbi:hypothetical protein L228DRAFT_52633 [Xylona heveae TC161]|uniref:Membrane anchor Opy2 N-terminal domain-containing protein n=1 Tax=Xylona heveae (strain CBS 132557 / TC161) TaxID=1328760 RepID=A0A164ZF04_XYLHT|nr:hypothetical protein L228DRAFT_52633 [Xylona heveae TC161]KZF19020.1 hypothetical protein L228DRAFT_52633 [Xylona heveae TC161]
MAFVSSGVEETLRTIFRRCISCSSTPPCPSCASDEVCSLSSQSCTQCPVASCIKMSGAGSSSPSKSSGGGSVNKGVIAGSVIGGVVVIGLLTYLIWRFCIKNKRAEYDAQWTEEGQQGYEKGDNFAMHRDARASTHTVGSIASTALTRASNVIQIAYIPGVTNRTPPVSPGVMVPPVPPLPLGVNSHKSPTPNFNNQDQHFFMPGDLRDSTYSGLTGDGRASYARNSISPSLARSSVATTLYNNNAIVNPQPAQTVVRGKANMVSVKSRNGSPADTPGSETPPVPAIDFAKHGRTALGAQEPADANDMRPPPSPAFSISSTFMKSTANTARAAVARPVQVLKGKAAPQADNDAASMRTTTFGRRPDKRASHASSIDGMSTYSRPNRYTARSLAFGNESSDDEGEPRHQAKQSLITDRDSRITNIEDSPLSKQSPFGDDSAFSSPRLTPAPAYPGDVYAKMSSEIRSTRLGHRKNSSLSAVIEESSRRLSRQQERSESPEHRESSPFSDVNEVKNA